MNTLQSFYYINKPERFVNSELKSNKPNIVLIRDSSKTEESLIKHIPQAKPPNRYATRSNCIKKQPRNSLCTCGSGIKSKKCCFK